MIVTVLRMAVFRIERYIRNIKTLDKDSISVLNRKR